MLIVTTETTPGYRIAEAMGTASGVGSDLGPAIQAITSKAQSVGANGVVGLRFGFPATGMVVAYGTAVLIQVARG